MPNIASILKEEIIRLTRKEFRQQVEPLKKQILAQRKQLTSLKQELETLRRAVKAGSKGARQADPAKKDPTAPAAAIRYSAAGLRKLRERLGLSRDAFAPLLGASSQAIYNWEQTDTRPRQEFLEKIASLRGLSKKQVDALLEQEASKKAARKPVATKKSARKPGTAKKSGASPDA
ncbi:helix-turn-helix family protein [Lysobacter antibioticus]|uniref:helix-turn-helix domain-containing protein n=1 Tax=Lysobacter antibioticus TaxID=84531 RepID=UPI000717182E|nr:helix-turn-helix transcriptional regulator [Lysobacter antibioticus]ALN64614.1 helix-turn-helix family protein [Lysobacter antibioticus]